MDTIFVINSVALWIVVLFNLLLTLALIRKVNSTQQIRRPEILKVGTKAPDFIIKTLSGEEIQRDSFDDKEIAMVFISPQCRGCKEHMPRLQELYPKAQKSDVELMVISLADIQSTAAYAQELNFNAPIYIAPRDDNTLMTDFKVPGTPSFYLIGQHGKILTGGFLDQLWDELAQKWSV